MSNPSLIVLWGSPSSGKTITTVKLAQTLAAHKKNVLVVCSDALCPSIAAILPHQATEQRSLGELLSLPTLTQDELLRYALTTKSSPHLAFLGYKKGDHIFSYADYSHERAIDLLTLAKHTADFVIVDGASYLSNQLLTTAALELADLVVRLHTCDLKSMMFYASYLPLLSDSRFKQTQTLSVLSHVKPGQDQRTYRQVFGDISLELPHVASLEQQNFEAKLLDPLPVGKDTAAYHETLAQIAAMILPSDRSSHSPNHSARSINNVLTAFHRFKSLLAKKRGDDQ